jgi:hypothetical protein
MEKAKKNRIDKTALFLALESELLGSGNQSAGIAQELDRAILDLGIYFEDSAMLIRSLNIGALTYEHAFLRERINDTWVQETVIALLSEFRKARELKAESFWVIWRKWMRNTENAIKNTAAVATLTLQGNDNDLELYVLAKRIFREGGDLLEGSLQPFIRLRLEVWEILNWRSPSRPPVEKMSFGDVISELSRNDITGHIYNIPPFGISVSQLRNIANHNNFEVVDDQIICTYGSPGKQKSINLCLEDVLKAFRYCNDLMYAHKIAREFFSIDNTSKLLPIAAERGITDYTLDCNLAYGLVSAGFSIINVAYSPKDWVIRLKDRHFRNKRESKLALQEACYPYIIFSSPVHFVIHLQSGPHLYKFSFLGSIANKNSEIPRNFDGDIRSVDELLRIKKIM